MINKVTKYMCTVETKNYPIVSMVPNIPRYSSIRKGLNASEIANCLAMYATVILHKKNGIDVKLNRDTFKKVLVAYKNELLVEETKKNMLKEEKKNTEAIEEMKKEVVVETTPEFKEEEIIPADSESLEEIESDPEDPDVNNFSYIDNEEAE